MRNMDRKHKHLILGLAVVALVGGYVWYIRNVGGGSYNPYPESQYKFHTEGPGDPGGGIVRAGGPLVAASEKMTKRELWNGASTQSFPLSRGF